MTMNRHIAAEEVRELAKSLVVHFGIGVSLVVDLADVDVGYGLALRHGDLSPLPSHTFDDEVAGRKA
ncbi:hypothetical protein D3C80_1953620 [compost metagenome]